MAFAKYYWEQGGEALKSGDTSLLKTLASEDCNVCTAYVDSIDEDAKKGLHANKNPSQIKSAKVTAETEGMSDEVVTLEVTDKKYLVVDETGEPVGQTDPVDYDIQIYVNWEDSRWTVVDSYMITK